jgi:hypothetical protein
MNDITQAIGELAQGGLTVRAVEPEAGEGVAGSQAEPVDPTHAVACLNCGTVLVGSHCHACGQRGQVHKTLGAFFRDLLHGVLHFEGKLWRTLPMLAWRPGRLTREYIDGRRASYVSPIALFLFVVFLFFAVFSALGADKALVEGVDVDTSQVTAQAYEASGTEIATLRRRLNGEEDADDRAELEKEIDSLEQQRQFIGSALGMGEAESAGSTSAADAGSWVNSTWQQAAENPQLLIYKLQTNAYKFAWLLIPISVPFVALTFLWRRKFGLYDHTIFTTYSITFMFALVGLASLIAYFWSGTVGTVLLLYAPAHMYWQLRGTYALSRFSAFWRMLVLSAFAWVAIGIFAGVLAAMSE